MLGASPECVQSNICLNVLQPDGGINRQCVQYCNLDAGQPTCAAGACTRASGATFGVCYGADPSCQLFGAACSDPARRCFPVADGSNVFSRCVQPGTTAVGESCSTVLSAPSDCVEGAACFNVGGAGRQCVQLCNGDGGLPTCAAGKHCNPATGTNFGTCL